MAKPTGFLEFTRQTPAERDPLERVHDWQEFHLHMDDAALQTQGARCMDCGVPFCHTGQLINGMAAGCPINNLIPEWNDLIYRGLWREALHRLHQTNNFPEFTGRVCPAPCEGSCTLGIIDPPVTIKSIECAIVDHGFEQGWIVPQSPPVRTGKKVAVVGSGPAGLACAAQLNKAGHWVTVFERADRIGGLLMYGIPNMKLDKEQVVQRRVDLLAAEGVRFITNTEIGKDYPVDRLRARFDAIVLCGGAGKPNDLPIPGRELKGIYFALDFLRGNTRHLLDERAGVASNGHFISAEGRDVVVMGGGDTGTDCVATSLRHGCRSLAQFEIVPRPPDARAADNPWPQWPRVFKQDYGQVEAQARYGADPRIYQISTKRFVGDENGWVKELHTVKVTMSVENGRLQFTDIPGTEQVWPGTMVLLAMGFRGPEDLLLDQLGVARDARSNVQAEHGKFQTSIEGIFAAGDMRRGQSLVVWAINEGRGAAREVDRWLMGETSLP
ncbi:MAG: glutamate synthase subunit beta [Caldilineales bacterium]|nr:glutamate synthase subunit beta [Caldilineales bacterium]